VKIRYRILLGFAIILSIGFCFLIFWILTDLNIQPKKSMEESLVDTANILAVYLEQRIIEDTLSVDELKIILNKASNREFSAQIYELAKSNINLRVYVMDIYGTVIFDSQNGEHVGKDFSRWNDVRLTIEGKYGSRTTRLDPNKASSSVAYIAAPIYNKGSIFGVVSIAKPWQSIHSFTQTTQKKIIIAAIIGFITILILSYFISLWITKPIRKLTHYANRVKDGGRVLLPDLGKGEIRILGESFEKMREALEGKEYVEKYTQTLTHQIKGPLTSIRGAAELLQEKLPTAERKKFIANIEKDSLLIQRIVDRVLKQAALEKRKQLQDVEKLDIKEILEEIIENLNPLISKKKIIVSNQIIDSCFFIGERF